MDLTARKRLDVKYHPSHEYRYWLYDPEGDGMIYYRTQDARDDAAEKAIAAYLDEGWADEVENVSAGEVTHFAQCLDKIQRPDELDEEGCDGEGTYWSGYQWMGNYTMAAIDAAAEEAPNAPLQPRTCRREAEAGTSAGSDGWASLRTGL
ncbi:hypothetical protein [Solimonas terrae]|uniref:Uncharacterized protein n=1 Tax=Solimonas terrae TaxID=1396819 RepID=A0A6M2BQ56_9GAMM|nr:hypothetical protein [Solimonas terrae]NGY04736.1 hypothetical protein [Solimonas terrae]